jgi:hypothetical protein
MGKRSASDSEMAPQVFEKARNRLGNGAPKGSPLNRRIALNIAGNCDAYLQSRRGRFGDRPGSASRDEAEERRVPPALQ